MEHKKFEELIDLIINENEEKARELFHEIIVEKSRQIYESIMEEEMMDEAKHDKEEDDLEEAKACPKCHKHDCDCKVEESEDLEESDDLEESEDLEEGMMDEMGMEESGMHGTQVGDLMDEISAEESNGGMTETDGTMEFGSDDEAHGDMEGKLDSIEDKLDRLMDEFEEIMGKGLDHEGGEEEAGEEEVEMGPDGEEEEEGEEEEVTEAEEEDESVMENVNLPKVPNPKHGDDGANAKSPSLHEPRVKAEGVKPVKFSGAQESVPTSPKGPSNAYSKGEGKLPGAGSFANTPGKNNFSTKGQAAPKPKHGDDGSNKKSPVAGK